MDMPSTPVTAEQRTRDCLQAIRARDGSIRAFLHIDEEAALAQARAVDAKRDRGEPLGLLAGLPVAIKDNLCARGEPTTCGSRILQNYRPPFDAHVVTRLRQADAVILGRTNLDEFAMGSSTENSAFQVTRNPWDPTRVAGGDTGGSIRQPASFCGVVGLKPSYGRVSRFGLVAFGSSLDQIGPFARDVTGAARLLEAIAGHDPRDSTSVDHPVPPYSQTVDQPVVPLTIGVAEEYFGEGLDPEVASAVRAAIEVYRSLGATVRNVALPHSRYAIATYYLVATAEASSNLARYDGVHFGQRSTGHADLLEMYERSRGEGFGAEVKRRIMLGAYALSSGYRDAYYLKALKVRRLIRQDFDRAFTDCDVIIGPTAPTPAFPIGEKSADPLAMYLADIYTISANLAGIAGISVPCGNTKSGLPIGLQLLAPTLAEERLLRIARMYERARHAG
jgi:aspartyl-tRNA(Asn)/glutamyl-tRNA(Gln) amidotransferase subunit A